MTQLQSTSVAKTETEPPERVRSWAFYDCENQLPLEDPSLHEKLRDHLVMAGFECFGSICHKFGPGVTAVVIIGASCADVHTWPEKGTAIVRIFYCQDHSKHEGGNNDAKSDAFLRLMLELFKPKVATELPRLDIPVEQPLGLPRGWRIISALADKLTFRRIRSKRPASV